MSFKLHNILVKYIGSNIHGQRINDMEQEFSIDFLQDENNMENIEIKNITYNDKYLRIFLTPITVLNACLGNFHISLIKDEYRKKMKEIEEQGGMILCIPSEWSEDICLEKLSLEESLALNIKAFLGAGIEYEILLDGKLINYKDVNIDIQELKDLYGKYCIDHYDHFKHNEIYHNLEKDIKQFEKD